MRGEVAPWVDLQIVAFPQEGILSYPNGLELLEESLRLGADVVGAIPHFEFTRELGVESLHKAIDLAKRYDLPVDVHCDEIDDEQSRFLGPWPCSPIATASAHGSPPATPRRCTPTTAPTPRGCSAC